ncbi:hypothetical protein BCU84_16030 [Shewanella sp. 10N.286.51.B7]|uniref:hypothetical protein n=1 Tax=Shewanella sp. 10N.286.51.B7 TaxID=1880836 RepID=UPI000C81586B|nr:hypothetical protein [Shewanella sp. 10N.286.51.B7]PMG75407.1 hypothetical protein BCU84_16030 [Shewanella sp. 10N.286.51.B7]
MKVVLITILACFAISGCASNKNNFGIEPGDSSNFVSEIIKETKVSEEAKIALIVTSKNLDESRHIESLFQEKLPQMTFKLASDSFSINDENILERLFSGPNPATYVLFIRNSNARSSGCDTTFQACITAVKISRVKAILFNPEGMVYQAFFDLESGGHDTGTVDGFFYNLLETQLEENLVDVISYDLVSKQIFPPVN